MKNTKLRISFLLLLISLIVVGCTTPAVPEVAVETQEPDSYLGST
jgi:hypothetical protein